MRTTKGRARIRRERYPPLSLKECVKGLSKRVEREEENKKEKFKLRMEDIQRVKKEEKKLIIKDMNGLFRAMEPMVHIDMQG